MFRRHPIAFAYLFALALWGALALQLRAEPGSRRRCSGARLRRPRRLADGGHSTDGPA